MGMMNRVAKISAGVNHMCFDDSKFSCIIHLYVCSNIVPVLLELLTLDASLTLILYFSIFL